MYMLYTCIKVLLKFSEEAAVRREIIYAYYMRVYCPTRKGNTSLNTEIKYED
jgi:hypothetical protein